MSEMSAGTALRQLRQAQAGMRKARQLMKQARENPPLVPKVLEVGWASLIEAHRLMAAIPLAAADEAVMTQQLAVHRYGTALLVRLRRLQRTGGLSPADRDDDSDVDEEDDID